MTINSDYRKQFLAETNKCLGKAVERITSTDFSLEDISRHADYAKTVSNQLIALKESLSKAPENIKQEVLPILIQAEDKVAQLKINCEQRQIEWENKIIEQLSNLFSKVCIQPVNRKYSGLVHFGTELNKISKQKGLNSKALLLLSNPNNGLINEIKSFSTSIEGMKRSCELFNNLITLLNESESKAAQFFLEQFSIQDKKMLCKTIYSLYKPNQNETDHLILVFFDNRFTKDQKITALKKCHEIYQGVLVPVTNFPKKRPLSMQTMPLESLTKEGFELLSIEIVCVIFSFIDSNKELSKLRTVSSTFRDAADYTITGRYRLYLKNKELSFSDVFQFKSMIRNYLENATHPKTFTPPHLPYGEPIIHVYRNSKNVFLICQSRTAQIDYSAQECYDLFSINIWDVSTQAHVKTADQLKIVSVLGPYFLFDNETGFELWNLDHELNNLCVYQHDYPIDKDGHAVNLQLLPFAQNKILLAPESYKGKAPTVVLFDTKSQKVENVNLANQAFFSDKEGTFHFHEHGIVGFREDNSKDSIFYNMNNMSLAFNGIQGSVRSPLVYVDDGVFICRSNDHLLYNVFDVDNNTLLASYDLIHLGYLVPVFSVSKLGHFVVAELEKGYSQTLVIGKVVKNQHGRKKLLTQNVEIDGEIHTGKFSEIIPAMFLLIGNNFQYSFDLSQFPLSKIQIKKSVRETPILSDFFDYDSKFEKILVKDYISPQTSLRKRKLESLKMLLEENKFEEAMVFFEQLSLMDKNKVYAELEKILGCSQKGYLGQGEDAWLNQNGQTATNAQKALAITNCFNLTTSAMEAS